MSGSSSGISVYAPVIVKYRDAKTDTKIQLEDLHKIGLVSRILLAARFGAAG